MTLFFQFSINEEFSDFKFCYFSLYLSSILNLIYYPFVSLSNLIKNALPKFNAAIKNKVNYAVANLINGEIVAPIFPTTLTHPKLIDVIYAG